MSENDNIPVTANVLGTIGTVFWCIQLVPQIWHNWRRKKTDGLPASMMLLWAGCAVPFGIYMILQDVNIPLQIQPQLFGFFAFISWGQVLYYNHSYSRVKATALVIGSVALSGGLEALLILTLRIPYRKGNTWPALLFGVIAAILLALGLIPPYFELRKREGRVIGINWFFLSLDSLGALFSLLALAAQGSFDILGGVLYIVVLMLELGIFASHIVWRLRHRKLLRTAKESRKTVDEILEETERAKDRGQPSEGPENGAETGTEADETKQATGNKRPGDLESHGNTATTDSQPIQRDEISEKN